MIANISNIFIKYLDIVYLIYGLALITLSILIFLQIRATEKSEFRLLRILWLLGMFGVTHSIDEFFEMLILYRGDNYYLILIKTSFLLTSFIFLFLFGYFLITISIRKKINIFFPIIFLIMGFFIIAYLGENGIKSQDRLEIYARYILCFTGAILSSFGFYKYYQSESIIFEATKVKKYFFYASIFFLMYGIFAGLIVPVDSFFPASVINYRSFFLMSGIPIQIFRALNAIGITWSVWHILNIFNMEEAAGRNLAEKKIRDQAALLEKATDAIIVCDLEHRINFWNKSAVRMYGYAEEEAIGRNACELLIKESSPLLIEAKKKVIEQGEWIGEMPQVTKEGREIIVESRWTLVRNSDWKPKSILVFNTDITEKNRLLRELEERKNVDNAFKMFAIALEEAPDGVQIVGLDGHIIYSNKTVEKIYGFSPEEFKGKHVNELNEDPAFADKFIIPALKGAGHWAGELNVKHKNGKTVPVLLNVSVFPDEFAKPLAMIGIIRDLTEQKEIEQLEKQLLQADKLATVGQLASGVAHEINNPLGNISLYAQMLLKTVENENERNKLNIINDESNRAAHIVKGLLDFARQSEPRMTLTDVNNEVRKGLDLLEHQMKDIKVTTIFQTLPEICCDPGQISQVIINMITNSIQAIKENGEIKIETRLEKNNIEIIISDNGCGIPEKNLGKIFDPFFTTKEPGVGTGLGLSISYGIIKRHNGSIEVKSQLGKGTTFVIKLPK
jgi:PAS domain S-box-containing protein